MSDAAAAVSVKLLLQHSLRRLEMRRRRFKDQTARLQWQEEVLLFTVENSLYQFSST